MTASSLHVWEEAGHSWHSWECAPQEDRRHGTQGYLSRSRDTSLPDSCPALQLQSGNRCADGAGAPREMGHAGSRVHLALSTGCTMSAGP